MISCVCLFEWKVALLYARALKTSRIPRSFTKTIIKMIPSIDSCKIKMHKSRLQARIEVRCSQSLIVGHIILLSERAQFLNHSKQPSSRDYQNNTSWESASLNVWSLNQIHSRMRFEILKHSVDRCRQEVAPRSPVYGAHSRCSLYTHRAAGFYHWRHAPRMTLSHDREIASQIARLLCSRYLHNACFICNDRKAYDFMRATVSYIEAANKLTFYAPE